MIANFVLAGQSNLDQWFHAGDGAALEAFKETFLALNPEYTDVQFFDAARGGSAMLSGSASDYADRRAPDDPELHDRISQNYWYDETTGTAGPNLTLFAERLEAEVAAGTEFLGVIWAQGEADTTYVGANGAEDYTEGLEFVLDQLMQAADAPEVYIQALGDRAFYSEELHGGSAAIRDAQEAVADGSDAITLATTIFDLELRDSVHLTDAGYEVAAHRMAIAISTGETSPGSGESFLLDPTTLLVQIDLAPGQSIVGPVALAGFTLSENGSEIQIASASITATGLLRIETLDAMTAPTLSYGAVDDSVTMQAGDYLFATGPSGTVPIMPFDLTIEASRLLIEETSTGLRMESGALSEEITGLSGDDELIGNAGHDTLIGGWGSDTMTGGDGKDTFVLGEDMRVDVVTDFDVTEDRIGLTGFAGDQVTISAHGDTDVIIQTAEGQGMVLEGVSVDQADDILLHMLGSDADNNLAGSADADRIFAQGGDDTINSGAGTDRITTGEGRDVVTFGSGFDTNVVYDFDLTQDSIQLVGLTASSLTFKQYKGTDLELRTEDGDRLVLRNVDLADKDLVSIIDAPPTVGFLTGTEGNDVLRGTALDEVLEGFGGTDRLTGGGGDDVFVFREGSDLNVVYDFTAGQDRILIDAAAYDTMNFLTYKDTDAELRLASGDRLVLRNVDVATLDADDFIFALPEEFL